MHEQSRARIQNESLAGIRQLLHGNQVQSFFIRGRNQKALDYELAAILKLPRRVRNLRPRELRPVRERDGAASGWPRSEEHTSELQSQSNLVCRLLLEKKKINN